MQKPQGCNTNSSACSILVRINVVFRDSSFKFLNNLQINELYVIHTDNYSVKVCLAEQIMH